MRAAGVLRADAAEGIFVPEEFDLQKYLRDVRRGWSLVRTGALAVTARMDIVLMILDGGMRACPCACRIEPAANGEAGRTRQQTCASGRNENEHRKVPVSLSALAVAGSRQTYATARR
jgi:hypothetical protein